MSDPFFAIESLTPARTDGSIARRAARAGQAMLTFFTFAPGAVVPVHAHPHDQLSVVVSGRAEFEVDGAVRILGPGEGACLPGGTPHGVRILDAETRIWDAWAPLRQEYLDPETKACAAASAR